MSSSLRVAPRWSWTARRPVPPTAVGRPIRAPCGIMAIEPTVRSAVLRFTTAGATFSPMIGIKAGAANATIWWATDVEGMDSTSATPTFNYGTAATHVATCVVTPSRGVRTALDGTGSLYSHRPENANACEPRRLSGRGRMGKLPR